MAHKRKDTLTKPPEWWKHLRPFNKRKVAKAERKAAKKEIEQEVKACEHDISGAVRKGSFSYVCPKCGQDITLLLVMLAESIVEKS